MQKNIKKVLVIFPMIFLLCVSFIGINAKAEVNVDKQQEVAITSSEDSKTISKSNDAKVSSNDVDTTNNKTENKQGSNKNEELNKEAEVEEVLPAWKNIDGKLHYVTESGIVEEIGWFKEKDENPDADNDNEYYLDEDYAATIGWKEIKDSWYYFNEAGVKQIGWQLIEGSWYHLDSDGIMQTGWIYSDGKRYHLSDKGVAAIGKNYIEDKWYFFGDKGVLQTGTYVYEGKYYYSTIEGIMVANEWVTINNNKYYVKADSSIATGNAIINNVMEKFDASGKYIGPTQMEAHLFIKYLNVGDGDCEFIKLPNGETALIDTGDVKISEKVVDFLKSQELKKEDGKGVIDYIIITHGHSDHIGGLAAILDEFKVKKVYMPDIAKMKDWSSDIKVTEENADEVKMIEKEYEIYEDAVKAMKDHNMEFTNTKNGEFIDKDKILKFVQSDRDFGPLGSEDGIGYYWGLNDNSAIVYLNYGDLQALFTADMEWKSERYFWSNNLLDSKTIDVLKVPHHGHDTSSTGDFIMYLKPAIGTISRAQESIEKNEAYNNLISCGVSLYEVSAKDGISICATKENWTVQN